MDSPIYELNAFPNKPWFSCVYGIMILKILWEKEKLLVTSNFSFSHSVFYPLDNFLPLFINKFKIVVCKLVQFERVRELEVWERVNCHFIIMIIIFTSNITTLSYILSKLINIAIFSYFSKVKGLFFFSYVGVEQFNIL